MAANGNRGAAILGVGAVAGGLLIARVLLRGRPRPPSFREPRLAARPTVEPPRPAPSHSKSATSRKFDPLFAKYGRGMPVAYLRSLARGESGLNPLLIDPKGARGLLQVVHVVRVDFNERHKTHHTPADLL